MTMQDVIRTAEDTLYNLFDVRRKLEQFGATKELEIADRTIAGLIEMIARERAAMAVT